MFHCLIDLGSKGNNASTRRHGKIPLTWMLRLPPGHGGLLPALNQGTKQGITVLAGLTDPDQYINLCNRKRHLILNMPFRKKLQSQYNAVGSTESDFATYIPSATKWLDLKNKVLLIKPHLFGTWIMNETGK